VTLIDGKPVAFHFTEYAVRYNDGTIHECTSATDAQLQADAMQAEAITHEVYEMEWETL
jgi:hypothetical protein